MRCGDSETKLAVSLTQPRGECWRHGPQKRPHWSRKTLHATTTCVFTLLLHSNVPPELTPSLFFVSKQREETEAFALCPSGDLHFPPHWVRHASAPSLLMGGLLWPQDTGLRTLVVVSMGMSRTWGGIRLTGNLVYCWLSGMGAGGCFCVCSSGRVGVGGRPGSANVGSVSF